MAYLCFLMTIIRHNGTSLRCIWDWHRIDSIVIVMNYKSKNLSYDTCKI